MTTPKDSRPAEIPCGSKRGNRFSVCDGIFSLPCFFHGRVVVQLFVVPFETGLSYILLGYSYGKSPFLMILIGRSSISRFIYIYVYLTMILLVIQLLMRNHIATLLIFGSW